MATIEPSGEQVDSHTLGYNMDNGNRDRYVAADIKRRKISPRVRAQFKHRPQQLRGP